MRVRACCEAELSLTGEEFVDLAEHLGPSNDTPSLSDGDIHLGIVLTCVDAGTSSSCRC
jgi:hypothetical protein